MSQKDDLIIRSPEGLQIKDRLKKLADSEGRSMNMQAIRILDKNLPAIGSDEEEGSARATGTG